MKNILITGGHGILGSRLIRLLSKKKYNLFILERKLKKKILSLELPTTIKTIYGDFKDENKISEIIKKKLILYFTWVLSLRLLMLIKARMKPTKLILWVL